MDHERTPPVWPGRHDPLGATWGEEATNFAVYAPEATSVDVCLFDEGRYGETERRFRLTEQTLGIWHGAVPGVPRGQRYGFRADGPWDPERGRRFNPAKLLLDPYARAVAGDVVLDDAIFGYVYPGPTDDPVTARRKQLTRDVRDSAPYVARGVVVHDDFDWGADTRPRT
ncbi:MAG: hypothetical protein ACTHOK_03445, partial [Nocardioidaceae bacterium]